MKTKAPIAVLAALGLGVAFAVHAARQGSQAREAMAELTAQRAEAVERARRIETRLQAAKDSLAALEPTTTAADFKSDGANRSMKVASTGIDQPAKAAAVIRRLSPQAIIANDPKKLAEYARNFRDGLDWDYGGMFKALKLSPEQIEKFKDMKVRLEETRLDLQAAIETQGLDPNGAEAKKLWADWQKQRLAKEAELMGDLTDRYREYYRTQVVRNYAQELAYAGVFTGEVAPAATVERVADILIANSKRVEKGTRRGWVEPNTINWTAASEQLKEVLSSKQIEMIAILIERDVAQAKLWEQTNRLTAQFKGQPPPK